MPLKAFLESFDAVHIIGDFKRTLKPPGGLIKAALIAVLQTEAVNFAGMN